ncbi:putative phosphatase regulatory subunit-domain-containing protein [Lentinula guzmanii]|uniref:Phosphatase regulatory subunit-domain-containing protein n=1 Tax=Lentinula guzmanii TaxID=2804957 RepID=A0AA38JC29_9AGAR|nr:putative phosphatase regulatory subunit-domain-containing protein [Lentinula guzmanii]
MTLATSSLRSNTAGSPLPLLPRRSSTSRANGSSQFSAILSPPRASPVKITVQQATPPEDDRAAPSSSAIIPDSVDSSSSSSSSNSHLSPAQSRGKRGSRKVISIDPTSPTLAIPRSKKERASGYPEKPKRVTESDSSSSKLGNETLTLSLSLEGLPRTLVEFPSVEQTTYKSAPVPPVIVVRKKSGQLVKPSLKSSKSAFKGSLNVTPGGFTKSEPATPTVPKAVKFDSRLEHVKLFLAEQRPLAVSRDGSPTDDTSGTESEFPSFIFGDRKHTTLRMTVTNMPPSLNLDANIVLEEIKLGLDESSIVGRIRIRNISFQKWVAVRFTFDDWQTTSEVTAKYIESCNSKFDIFGFSIRLSDLLARIEEKTLIVALRYNVNGKEIWDNNFGRNYVVKFSKELRTEPSKDVGSGSDRDVISSGTGISDLHSRLEKVVKRRDDSASLPREPPLDLKTDMSLGSRYDFGAALKDSKRITPRDHTRTHSYPMVASHSVNSSLWPQINRKHRSIPKEKSNLGSPREFEDTFRPAPFIPSDSEEGPEVPLEHAGRHHQRGYFDMSPLSSLNVKMTPPGTPIRSRSLDDTTPLASPRFNSLPLMRPGSPYHPPGLGFATSPKDAVLAEARDGAFSSITPPLSNLTTPTDSPLLGASPLEPAPGTNYHQFLNRFCFFTGSESSGNSSDESAPEILSRSSSISSIDDFLSTSSSSPRLFDPAFRLSAPQPVTQTRDDISLRIGLSMQAPYVESESRSVTPVAR